MNGILLIDKPADWTSMDVCAHLRGICKEKRIGHAGTLDPMATGMLPVFIGGATKAISFVEAAEKEYAALLRPGTVTDTQDITGQVLSQYDGTLPDEIPAEILARFTGTILQTPPMYSALKVNGERLYHMARRGASAEIPPREIRIFDLRVEGKTPEGDFRLYVRCSKGTYIRTLCSDIGDALSCGGCMSALRRLSVGTWNVKDAHPLEEVRAAADAGTFETLLLPVDSVFSSYLPVFLSASQFDDFRNGRQLREPLPDGDLRLYAPGGAFCAAVSVSDGKILSRKSFQS